jgi:catechol 2,3-dioxygenase-like lactoylglutathione lyase family enzyme
VEGTAQPRGEVPFEAVEGAFFALVVPDLEASTRWYADVMGLAVTMRVPMADGVAVTVLEGGGLTVELLQRTVAVTPAEPDRGRLLGVMKVGFVVRDLDGALARLRERGAELVMGPFPASGGQRANALIRDGDGTLIQLFGR